MSIFFISLICSVRVSNKLGAGHPKAARLAAGVVLTMTILEGLLIGLLFIFLRNFWGYAYSSEIEVVEFVAKSMPTLAIVNFFGGLQRVLSGNNYIVVSDVITYKFTKILFVIMIYDHYR